MQESAAVKERKPKPEAEWADIWTEQPRRVRIGEPYIAMHREMIHLAVMDLTLDPNVNRGANWPAIQSAYKWLTRKAHEPYCRWDQCAGDGGYWLSLEFCCLTITKATGRPMNESYIRRKVQPLLKFVGNQIGKRDKARAQPSIMSLGQRKKHIRS